MIHRLVLFDETAWESDYDRVLEFMIGSRPTNTCFRTNPQAGM